MSITVSHILHERIKARMWYILDLHILYAIRDNTQRNSKNINENVSVCRHTLSFDLSLGGYAPINIHYFTSIYIHIPPLAKHIFGYSNLLQLSLIVGRGSSKHIIMTASSLQSEAPSSSTDEANTNSSPDQSDSQETLKLVHVVSSLDSVRSLFVVLVSFGVAIFSPFFRSLQVKIQNKVYTCIFVYMNIISRFASILRIYTKLLC